LAILPKPLRALTPARVRDDRRLRAAALAAGLIPPRTMHSEEDRRILLDAAAGALRVVEIGVYEGASALALLAGLGPDAELHLVDPFGSHADALPAGWGASEWATRRTLARASRRLGASAPRLVWHVALSHTVAAGWQGELDLLFIDGDHSREGCELDWCCWREFVAPGGRVVFHDARADRPGGRGLPGPTAVVAERFRDGAGLPGWRIAAEADRTVAVVRGA